MDSDRKWESLLKISEEAHTATSIEDFVATIHGILANLINARNFFIALYEESSDKYFFPYFVDEFDTIETAGVRSGYDESLDVTLYDLSGTLTDYVRRTGASVTYPNETMSPLFDSGEVAMYGSQSPSWLGVPLKHSGHTIGVMVVQDYEKVDSFSTQDEELMLFVSDHIARAIESVRNEEKIKKQHELVLRQKEEITDSIAYARRIQKATLPSPAYIKNFLPEYFTIYKPKDIISGDFYWVRKIEGFIVVIVADCTGHGVPGALMSMLGMTLLNEQFRTFGIRQPDVILRHLRNKVKEVLAQEGLMSEQKDGIDMAIAIIDPESNKLQFAGANRPLFLVRKKGAFPGSEEIPDPSMENEDYELHVIKGDNQPIGVNLEEKDFTNNHIKLQAQDCLYMFSDGFVDQFGGSERKKFKTRNFKKLLLSVQDKNLSGQGKEIEKAFDTWRGMHEQIDDVCVFGLKIM